MVLRVHRIGVIDDAEAAATSGNHSVPVKPNEWKNGSTPTITSSGFSWKICARASTFARMLRCVSITPFGTPVLPLEKMTVASDSASPSFA